MPSRASRSTTPTKGRDFAGSDDDSVDVGVDHGVDDFDLAREIGLLRRPLPLNVDTHFTRRGHGMNALLEDMGDGFRYDTDSSAVRTV